MNICRSRKFLRTFSANFSSKVYPNANAALFDIKDGAKLCVGGFGVCGIPEKLILAVRDSGAKYVQYLYVNIDIYYFLF